MFSLFLVARAHSFFPTLEEKNRARKIFSVPVAELSRVPFFWSHCLSSWSQSCAKTQKFRRKKKKEAIFEASFCTHPDTNIINEMIAKSFILAMKIDEEQKNKEKKNKPQERSLAHFILMKP